MVASTKSNPSSLSGKEFNLPEPKRRTLPCSSVFNPRDQRSFSWLLRFFSIVVAEDSLSIFASLPFFPRTETVTTSFFSFLSLLSLSSSWNFEQSSWYPFVILPQLFDLPDCLRTPGIGCPVVFEKFPSISTLVRASMWIVIQRMIVWVLAQQTTDNWLMTSFYPNRPPPSLNWENWLLQKGWRRLYQSNFLCYTQHWFQWKESYGYISKDCWFWKCASSFSKSYSYPSRPWERFLHSWAWYGTN